MSSITRERVPATCAVVAGFGAVVVSHTLFPYLSGDHDEAVYLTQADALAHGHLTLPLDRVGPLHPSLTGVARGRVVFPFPHGWPAVLAAARAVGSTRVALVAVAAFAVLAVALLARETLDEARARAVGVVLFTASPLIWLLSGTYLPYVFHAGVASLTVALVLRATRTGSVRAAVGAGLAGGCAFALRPYDAVLTAVVVLGYVFLRRRHVARSGLLAVAAATGALGPVAATLAVNRSITGRLFTFPLQVTGGSNAFGFGTRRVDALGLPFHYTVRAAFFALKQNSWFFPTWVAGSWLVVAAAAWTVWTRRRDANVLLLAAFALVWPVGYFFWWASQLTAPGARDGMGPHYYVPAVAPIVLLAAPTIVAVVARVATRWRSGAAVAVVVVIAAATVVFLPGKMRDKLDVSDRERAAVAAARRAPAHSVVVMVDVLGVGSPHPTLRNGYALDAPVLYAGRAEGAALAALRRRFPGRTFWRLSFDFVRWRLDPLPATS